MKKLLQIDDIGEITINQTKRSKYFRLSVKSSGKLVSIPEKFPFYRVEKLLKDKKDWIKKNLGNIKPQEKEIISPNTSFKTRNHTVMFYPHQSQSFQYKIEDEVIKFYYPENCKIEDEFLQKFLKKSIDAALRIEAQACLPEKLNYFSAKTGLKYKDYKLVNVKTFWACVCIII